MRKLLVAIPDICDQHRPGNGWPERPARLDAIRAAASSAAIAEFVEVINHASSVPDADLLRVHTPDYVASVKSLCERGGGPLDPETFVSEGSYDAAVAAAGAGLDMVEALRRGTGRSGFVAVRPPGHHAFAYMGMGFCVFNNIAITAAHLAADDQRVVIIDWDVHHGNGTEQTFWNDPSVMYVSIHQSPLFPDSGAVTDTGGHDAPGTTANVPLPPGATGDIYLRVISDLVIPLMERFKPDWVLISAGYDTHRSESLSEMCLESGDYGAMTRAIVQAAPAADRVIMFLEGGYDLDALQASVTSTFAALVDVDLEGDPTSSGGRGLDALAEARAVHRLT